MRVSKASFFQTSCQAFEPMPREFVHARLSPPTDWFRCTLQCEPCSAMSTGGQPCRRRVCVWLPYCWQHSRQRLGVITRDSLAIPGTTGLFALRPIASGSMIVPYLGERLSERDILHRYGSGPLALGPYLVGGVDAACRRGIGSASNGAFGQVSPGQGNAVLHPTSYRYDVERKKGTTYQGRVHSTDNMGIKWWVFAKRDIEEGEEILLEYGQGYVDAFARRASVCREQGIEECSRTVRSRRR